MSPPVDIRLVLLEALREGEAFGLQVIERIEQRTRRKMRFAQGTVYPALRALERDGLIKSRESEPLPDRGGRPRVYYTLTAKGRAAAAQSREMFGQLFLLGEQTKRA